MSTVWPGPWAVFLHLGAHICNLQKLIDFDPHDVCQSLGVSVFQHLDIWLQRQKLEQQTDFQSQNLSVLSSSKDLEAHRLGFWRLRCPAQVFIDERTQKHTHTCFLALAKVGNIQHKMNRGMSWLAGHTQQKKLQVNSPFLSMKLLWKTGELWWTPLAHCMKSLEQRISKSKWTYMKTLRSLGFSLEDSWRFLKKIEESKIIKDFFLFLDVFGVRPRSCCPDG